MNSTTPLTAADREQPHQLHQPSNHQGEADNNFSSLNDYIKQIYTDLTNNPSADGPRSENAEATQSTLSPFNIGDENNQEVEENSSLFEFKSAKWTLRRIALELSLYLNLFITVAKLVAFIDTFSLSVLAALLDSVLDVVSQVVLYYTEKRSSMQRSSAFYPAGASRLEPIGVLTCAALMGMASFEVLKESGETLIYKTNTLQDSTIQENLRSFWTMIGILVIKFFLYNLCKRANHRAATGTSTRALQLADPTLEALAQDHRNDLLSNGVAAVALIVALYSTSLWWLDPVGATLISLYIIWSWYRTGKEQIEQLIGKSAPKEFMDELHALADDFDERMQVDTIRAYHFGPKFLVEVEVVMPEDTPLKESHDAGMELQYEIEAQEDVERCFVHIDYETREYDEHVVSKAPEVKDALLRRRNLKTRNSSLEEEV